MDMQVEEALILVTVPGYRETLEEGDAGDWRKTNPELEKIIESAKVLDPESHWVDTALGWACLNQDWYQFHARIDTSWSWCKVLDLPEGEWEDHWLPALESGKVLMMIYYQQGDDPYSPHG
jgi:hypothetical protein